MSITIDDFKKVEIKIGTVLSAEKVPDADKLIKLIFDLGTHHSVYPSGEEVEEKETRQIMSAIAPFVEDPQSLVGKQIAVCVNLEPRKFRGYESQGMILATGDDAETLSFLVPEKKVRPGAKVH